MNEIPEDALRISDTDREAAMAALGEHVSAGRLDIDEYGDRSAKITAAKTRGELSSLFRDLPHPRPRFGTQSASAAPQPPAASENADADIPAKTPGTAVARGIWGSTMTVIAVAAVVLFLVTHQWWWFLMIPLAAMLGGRGHGHRGFDHRGRGRQRMRGRY